MNYSNPRLSAEFTDWPLGGSKRGYCRFYMEHSPRRGWRAGRVTSGKPKFTTYCQQGCFVDGDDGRIYLLEDTGGYGFVSVMRSDFMQHETVHQGSDDRYGELMELIRQAHQLPVE